MDSNSTGKNTSPGISNCLSFFVNSTNLVQTGYATQIADNYSTFLGAGYNGSSSAITFYGYFKPAVTGIYTFILGNASTNKSAVYATYASNDDCTVFWFGTTAGMSISTFKSGLTESNYTKAVNYTHIASNSSSVNISPMTWTSPSLTAGQFYPLVFNWAQTSGGQVMFLQFISGTISTPSSSVITDGIGYFFS